MQLLEILSNRWAHVQDFLFPSLRRDVGALTPLHERLIAVLDMVAVERFLPYVHGLVGRQPEDRAAIARAFIAKTVANLPTTSALIERLHTDVAMRRLCGWEFASSVPSKSTFSRAFGEFSRSGLPSVIHEVLVVATHKDRFVGHVSRDSTAITAREKPVKMEDEATVRVEKAMTVEATAGLELAATVEATATVEVTATVETIEHEKVASAPKRKRGRPRKADSEKAKSKKAKRKNGKASSPDEADGASPLLEPKEEKRLDRQLTMTLDEALKDLPTHCAVGTKRNAKGYKISWTGYKLHIDTVDGDIPVACMLTSASLHDSQAAIPLAAMTAQRLQNYYSLMDAAYDAPQIFEFIRLLGQVPIIARNPRRGGKAEAEREALARRKTGIPDAESVRFRHRSAAERVNSNLKDNYGGRFVRVRGHDKVMCHLMFGVLAMTVEQLFRFVA